MAQGTVKWLNSEKGVGCREVARSDHHRHVTPVGCRATSRPIPRLAPVTNTTASSRYAIDPTILVAFRHQEHVDRRLALYEDTAGLGGGAPPKDELRRAPRQTPIRGWRSAATWSNELASARVRARLMGSRERFPSGPPRARLDSPNADRGRAD